MSEYDETMAVLKDEPHPFMRKMTWSDRLIFNTWRHPFPYLFHRWEIVYNDTLDGKPFESWCGSFVTKSGAQRWLDEWYSPNATKPVFYNVIKAKRYKKLGD